MPRVRVVLAVLLLVFAGVLTVPEAQELWLRRQFNDPRSLRQEPLPSGPFVPWIDAVVSSKSLNGDLAVLEIGRDEFVRVGMVFLDVRTQQPAIRIISASNDKSLAEVIDRGTQVGAQLLYRPRATIRRSQ